MSPDPTEHSRTVAIEQLQALGLSAYASRTFVALLRVGTGTAQDVSEVSDVPRTRVYDAVDELREWGLVDVEQSSPKRFWAISPETAGRHFEREYVRRVDLLTDALDHVTPTARSSEQRGVLTVTGRTSVSDRIVSFLQSADEEVVFMTVEPLLTERIVEALRSASERGVSIRFAGMSSSTETRLREEVPNGEPFESLWDWSDTPAGRLLMVDGNRTLVSVLAADDHASDDRDETAIWGSGDDNSLVVVLRAMFTWQLGHADDGSDPQ